MNIQEEVLKYKNDLIDSLQETIKIKSVEEEPKPGKPFGEGPAKALNNFLEIAKKLGFKTENFDNYVGHVVYGEGEETIGILGHVDVVPEGLGWDYPPYSGKIVDNKMYGRGTLDDKGPLMICLYALKALKDLKIPMKRKVKIIVGTNEETNWGCMKHYFETLNMPQPVMSFTPDSSFPVTFAEKGIIRGLIKIKTNFKDFELKGGDSFNAVPEKSTLTLPISYKKDIEKKIKDYNNEKIYKIKMEVLDEKIVLTSFGKSSHAARPNFGYNSLSALMNFISLLNIDILGLKELSKYFSEKVKMEYNGKSAGLFFEDEPSGEITINYGKAYVEDGELNVSIDIRYPVTTDSSILKLKLSELFKKYGLKFLILKEKSPLYVKKESLLVKTLMEVYKEVTGDLDGEPRSTGGGTYAKALNNCVAFGAVLKGTEDKAHQKNECIDLSTIDTLLKIYVEAIYRLSNK